MVSPPNEPSSPPSKGGGGSSFLQILAGGLYGAGAALAGTDPTALAKQIEAQNARRRKEAEVESLKAAAKAGDPEAYKRFEEGMGAGTSASSPEAWADQWTVFSRGDQTRLAEADAGALNAHRAAQLKALGVDATEIMQSGASNTAIAGRLAEVYKPFQDAAIATSKKAAEINFLYKGMSDAEVRELGEVAGVAPERLSDLSRPDLEAIVFAAGGDPTSTASGVDLGILKEDWGVLSEMTEIPLTDVIRVVQDKTVPLGADRDTYQKLQAANAQLAQSRTKFENYEADAGSLLLSIQAGLASGDIKAKDAEALYAKGETELSNKYFQGVPPKGILHDIAALGKDTASTLSIKVEAVKNAQAWAANPQNTTRRKLANMEDGEFAKLVEHLPSGDKTRLTMLRDESVKAAKGQTTLKAVIALVGQDPDAAKLLRYSEFVEGGEFEGVAFAPLNELDSNPDAIDALQNLDQIDMESIQRLAPFIGILPGLGLGEGKVSVMKAIRDGDLGTDPASRDALLTAIDTMVAPLSDDLPLSPDVVLGLATTLNTFDELSKVPGAKLHPAVLAKLDRYGGLLKAVKANRSILTGSTFQQTWDSVKDLPTDQRFAGLHRGLYSVPSESVGLGLKGVISDDVSAQVAGQYLLDTAAAVKTHEQRTHRTQQEYIASGGFFESGDFVNGTFMLEANGETLDLLSPKSLGKLAAASGTQALNWLDEIGVIYSPDWVTTAVTGDSKWRTAAMNTFMAQITPEFRRRVSQASSGPEKSANLIRLNAMIKHAIQVELIKAHVGQPRYFGADVVNGVEGGASAGDIARQEADDARARAFLIADEVENTPMSDGDELADWRGYARSAASGLPAAGMVFHKVRPTTDTPSGESDPAFAPVKEKGSPGPSTLPASSFGGPAPSAPAQAGDKKRASGRGPAVPAASETGEWAPSAEDMAAITRSQEGQDNSMMMGAGSAFWTGWLSQTSGDRTERAIRTRLRKEKAAFEKEKEALARKKAKESDPGFHKVPGREISLGHDTAPTPKEVDEGIDAYSKAQQMVTPPRGATKEKIEAGFKVMLEHPLYKQWAESSDPHGRLWEKKVPPSMTNWDGKSKPNARANPTAAVDKHRLLKAFKAWLSSNQS